MEEAIVTEETHESFQDRFRGTLVGLAVGDALGAPLENQPAREPDHFAAEMTGGGRLKLASGQWTDETEMTLCVVESLLAKRVFDPDDIAHRLVVWADRGPGDLRMHTGRVLDAIRRGSSWEEASREVQELNPDDASNDSLARSTPLALFFYRHPDYLETLSPMVSRITHAHPDCEYACVALNVTLSWLLQGKSKTDAVEAAYAACAGASEEMRERIGQALLPRCERNPTDHVLDTLQVALWAFVHGTNFESAVLAAVNRGADADAVGAVTGALAGARYGLSSIPARWLAPLKERAGLLDYADLLLELARM